MTLKEINTIMSCIIADINTANECQRIINGDLKGNVDTANDVLDRCTLKYEHLIAICRMCDIYVYPRYTINSLVYVITVKYHDTCKEYKPNSNYRFSGV